MRSGKPGRFEHKKGGERGGIRRRAGVNREQTGTWDAKKGHLPSACDPADAGNGKRKSRGERQRFCAGAGAGTGTERRIGFG